MDDGDAQMKNPICIDSRLEPIFSKFLANQQVDFAAMKTAFKKLDYEELKRLCHRMHGTCGGYGLPRLGELAAQLERTAETLDVQGVAHNISLIENYFKTLKIRFQKIT